MHHQEANFLKHKQFKDVIFNLHTDSLIFMQHEQLSLKASPLVLKIDY